jgi:hypothetical protein
MVSYVPSSFLLPAPPPFLIPASSAPPAFALYSNRPMCMIDYLDDADEIERIDLVNVAFWYVSISIHSHPSRTRNTWMKLSKIEIKMMEG